MSLADTATNSAHEPHQRRLRSRPARSPSLTRSPPSTRSSSVSTTLSKRSPSPIVTFHPTPLSAENPKGVKNITRKVIKRLEGLGHLEMVDSEEEELMGSGEEREVEKALYAAGREAMKAAQKKLTIPATSNGHAKANGHANGHIATPKKQKTDLEIPRKVLHSSIGFLTLYLYVCEGDVRTVVLVLWMALAVIVPADLLRFNSQRFERTYERYLGFLMRESEKHSVNGVVWYIIGVNFALTFYPQDVATVAILILSWADTAASTVGRLYGSYTPKLPARLPILRLPLAPRKSVAGFIAACATGAAIAAGFWGLIGPLRDGGANLTWSWESGVRQVVEGAAAKSFGVGGALGLLAISLAAGLVSGVAEALDLGSVDDNLTLPIISGACILGFLKVLGLAASWFSS